MRFRVHAKGKRKRRGVMNKTESAFAQVLDLKKREGEIEHWEFETIKLQLGDGAWYTPDFWVLMPDGEIHFYETKGFMREAANVRIKVAATKYPFRFFLIKFLRGRWDKEEIAPDQSGAV